MYAAGSVGDNAGCGAPPSAPSQLHTYWAFWTCFRPCSWLAWRQGLRRRAAGATLPGDECLSPRALPSATPAVTCRSHPPQAICDGRAIHRDMPSRRSPPHPGPRPNAAHPRPRGVESLGRLVLPDSSACSSIFHTPINSSPQRLPARRPRCPSPSAPACPPPLARHPSHSHSHSERAPLSASHAEQPLTEYDHDHDHAARCPLRHNPNHLCMTD